MPVVGSGALVISEHNRICEVSPYTPDYDPLEVPMVDAVVKYNCPFDGKMYILLIQNALFVPSMNYNLLPPFMIREAGVIVRDTPKIQLDDPSEEDHALTFPETGFRIPLSLCEVFSHFPTTKPTKDDRVEPEGVYMLTIPGGTLVQMPMPRMKEPYWTGRVMRSHQGIWRSGLSLMMYHRTKLWCLSFRSLH